MTSRRLWGPAVAMAVLITVRKQSRRGEPENSQGSYRLEQICEFSHARWRQGLAAVKMTRFRQYLCVWVTNSRTLTNRIMGYFSFCSV